MKTRMTPARVSSLFGYTVVELLITLGAIAVLAGLILPVVSRTRQRARTVQCVGNLMNVGRAYTVCLIESSNYLPDAFYAVHSTGEGYEVNFKSIEAGATNSLFQTGDTDFLICPNDARADHVLRKEPPSKQFLVDASYAYNLRLPVGFKNMSRVPHPANTVSFYDGDPGLLVGTWNPESAIARDSVRPRHFKEANYLFLDGHVETRGEFPAEAFDGGVSWAAAPGNDSSQGGETPEARGVVGGVININPNNGNFEFEMILPDGFAVTQDDLHADAALQHAGFHPEYLEYAGPAVSVRLKAKGNGSQNSLTLDGEPYELENKSRYLIASPDMIVRLYNSKRNKQGKAMGKWWIEIDARDAEIEILD